MRLNPHLRAVRHLLRVLQKNLLADNLGDEEPLGVLAHRVLGVQCGPIGKVRHAPLLHRLVSHPGERAHGEHALHARGGLELALQRLDLVNLEQVALVDDHAHRRGVPALGREKTLEASERVPRGVHDDEDDVRVGHRAAHRPEHHLVELVELLLHHPGRVEQHHLEILLGDDAEDPVSRGLGLVRDDAELHPDELVEQRGFARVGAADDGDVAGFVTGGVASEKGGGDVRDDAHAVLVHHGIVVHGIVGESLGVVVVAVERAHVEHVGGCVVVFVRVGVGGGGGRGGGGTVARAGVAGAGLRARGKLTHAARCLLGARGLALGGVRGGVSDDPRSARAAGDRQPSRRVDHRRARERSGRGGATRRARPRGGSSSRRRRGEHLSSLRRVV